MYSTALGRFEPNPGLRAEIQTALETGVTARFGRYDVQAVVFHQRLDDAIARGAPPAGSDARYMRVNRDQVRSTGLEVLAGYTAGRLALETEATLQSVDVASPGGAGVRAEYEPVFAAGVGGVAPLPAGIEAAAELTYWSSQYCAAPSPGQEEYRELEPGTRADLQLSRSFRLGAPRAAFDRLSLELAVDNLTDTTVYDQCGLPRPGRTLRLQVRID
jgi:outer membrane receptor protein involved in Fe transport